MTVEAFIISWTGQHTNARSLAQTMSRLVDRVTVIYSDRAKLEVSGAGQWVQVPDDWFYGRKFKAILDRFAGTILLQITADVTCSNWPLLIQCMGQRFREMDVGVWSPHISFSGSSLEKVSIGPVSDSSLHLVTSTDSIVWAMRADVAERMRRLDYVCNNVGWGIDVAAAMHSHAMGKLVLIDAGIEVEHPPGRGYNNELARQQAQAFLWQLSLREQMQRLYLTRALRKYPRWRRALYRWTRRDPQAFLTPSG
jgi:hypothetical protein